MQLNFLCFKEHNLLRAAPRDRSCLEGKGWRLFFITVLCRDHYFAFYFISCSPVGGKVTGQTNADADSLIHHGLTIAPYHWLTCTQPAITCCPSERYTVHLDCTYNFQQLQLVQSKFLFWHSVSRV